MKNQINRIAAAVIAVLMIITMLSTAAYAAEPIANGKCGENVNWVLDSEGTLTITGTGEIDVSDTGDGVIHAEGIPWFNYRNDIRKVDIAEGITAIGDGAFEYCSGLRTVSIPSSVTEIKNNAFSYCEGLDWLTIPDSVKKLGDGVFSFCYGLKNITLPANLTRINPYMFIYCYRLEKITIPEDVENIGEEAFAMCISLKEVNIGSKVKSIGEDAFKTVLTDEDKEAVIKEYNSAVENNSELLFGAISIEFAEYLKSNDNSGVAKINYNNYEEEWQKIQIAEGNEELDKAEFSFRTDRVFADETSGISFFYDSDVFGKELNVSVDESEDKGSIALINEKSGAEKYKLYGFSFKDGKAFPEGGKLTVRIPVPEGFSAEDTAVYYIDPETGSLEKVNSVYEDGYLVVELSHFSVYAVIDGSSVPEPQPEEQSFISRIIAFFMSIIETIKSWFSGLMK